MDALKPYLATVAERSLSEDEASAAFETIMEGKATPAEIGAFLMALRVRGETVAEITGGARSMRTHAVKVTAPADAIDLVGTGGDGAHTYNISTAAAIIVAACGVPVAKHGNKAASSRSGSAEVLRELGVKLEIGPVAIAHCIEEAGIGFMFAATHHQAMKHVAPVRAELGIRTVFNLLGPLSNPAGVKRQLIGVYDRRWLLPFAEVLKRLGSEVAWIVHGSDGLDELTTTGPSYVVELKAGHITQFEVTPEDAGLAEASPAELVGGTPAENAEALRALLAGARTAYRDIVLLNAAAGLIVAGKAETLKAGAQLAADAIDSGRAAEVAGKLAATSQAGLAA